MDSIRMNFNYGDNYGKDGTWTKQCECKFAVGCNGGNKQMSLQQRLAQFDVKPRLE